MWYSFFEVKNLETFLGLLTNVTILKEQPKIVSFCIITNLCNLTCTAVDYKLVNTLCNMTDSYYTINVYGNFDNNDVFIVNDISLCKQTDITKSIIFNDDIHETY